LLTPRGHPTTESEKNSKNCAKLASHGCVTLPFFCILKTITLNESVILPLNATVMPVTTEPGPLGSHTSIAAAAVTANAAVDAASATSVFSL